MRRKVDPDRGADDRHQIVDRLHRRRVEWFMRDVRLDQRHDNVGGAATRAGAQYPAPELRRQRRPLPAHARTTRRSPAGTSSCTPTSPCHTLLPQSATGPVNCPPGDAAAVRRRHPIGVVWWTWQISANVILPSVVMVSAPAGGGLAGGGA